MLLQDKVVIVTGGTRGIGLAIVTLFATHGAHVFLNGRDPEKVSQTVSQLASQNLNVTGLPFDVSDPKAVKEGFQTFLKQSKTLDVVVNNAGILDDALIGMVSQNQIDRTFGINTFGPLYVSQFASRLMARRQSGSMVNLTSIIGRVGNSGQAVYAGSKAAIIGITQSLAKELAPTSIRVNAIAPGFIDTEMARSIPNTVFQERIDSIKMNRIGTPEEVAKVALFLASDLSSYVTGQIIGVDGGMLI